MVGYCYGVRFERQLCQEVELHLAYRQVVGVHVLARRDRAGGEADHLAVAAQRLSNLDPTQREPTPSSGDTDTSGRPAGDASGSSRS